MKFLRDSAIVAVAIWIGVWSYAAHGEDAAKKQPALPPQVTSLTLQHTFNFCLTHMKGNPELEAKCKPLFKLYMYLQSKELNATNGTGK